MKKVTVSPNGPKYSELVQGYWRLSDWNMSPQERLSFLKQHLELGITTIDHADIYGNYDCEKLFGEALTLDKSLQQQIQIITKCGIKLCSDKFPNRQINYYDTSKQHIIHSVEASLQNLQVERINTLLIHRLDVLMNADEVAEAFNQLKEQGKVQHFGVSNFTPSQFSLLQSRLDFPLVTNQVEINPLNFDVAHDGTLDQLQEKRTLPLAWSALAGGNIFHAQSEQAVRVRNELESIKEEIGAKGIDQVIYAWLRKMPSSPIPIIGSGKIERVKDAVDSLSLELDREQWFRVWIASKGHGVP